MARARTRLELRQTQRLGLSARVTAALAILRMPADDLAALLAREAAANPFLRPGLPGPRAAAADPARVEALVAPEADWQDELHRRVARLGLPGAEARLAEAIVADLDARGRLETPLHDLAAEAGVPTGAAGRVLAAVQGCGPPGVAARDLEECLALQLAAAGLDPAEARATIAELPRFARRDWAGLAAALGLDRAGAMARAALLRRLTPAPVGPASAAAAPTLRPDLVVSRAATGEMTVAPAAGHVARPSIDAALARRAAREGFGAEMLARAEALVRAVQTRGATLVRIGTWLACRQEAALVQGPAALVAATRAECAADLGLHPATVGRAAAGKALLFGGRVWPLAALFVPAAAAGAGRAAPGTAPAGPAAARRLAALIAAEPAGAPLSDAALQQRLAAEGVDIARRTVAKYRQGLRIPPAHRRRAWD